MREFDPASMIHMMSPTALLLIIAEKDSLASPPDMVKAIYERALEPKAMSVLPVRHFEIFCEPWLSKSANLAISWYKKHL